jgi:hypothetical protein
VTNIFLPPMHLRKDLCVNDAPCLQGCVLHDYRNWDGGGDSFNMSSDGIQGRGKKKRRQNKKGIDASLYCSHCLRDGEVGGVGNDGDDNGTAFIRMPDEKLDELRSLSVREFVVFTGKSEHANTVDAIGDRRVDDPSEAFIIDSTCRGKRRGQYWDDSTERWYDVRFYVRCCHFTCFSSARFNTLTNHAVDCFRVSSGSAKLMPK